MHVRVGMRSCLECFVLLTPALGFRRVTDAGRSAGILDDIVWDSVKQQTQPANFNFKSRKIIAEPSEDSVPSLTSPSFLKVELGQARNHQAVSTSMQRGFAFGLDAGHSIRTLLPHFIAGFIGGATLLALVVFCFWSSRASPPETRPEAKLAAPMFRPTPAISDAAGEERSGSDASDNEEEARDQIGPLASATPSAKRQSYGCRDSVGLTSSMCSAEGAEVSITFSDVGPSVSTFVSSGSTSSEVSEIGGSIMMDHAPSDGSILTVAGSRRNPKQLFRGATEELKDRMLQIHRRGSGTRGSATSGGDSLVGKPSEGLGFIGATS